jgi:DNA-directed RNA polymerase specialized sigma24 family protein
METRLRQRDVWKMLEVGGLTYELLGILLDVSTSTAYRDVKAVLKPTHWICPTCNTVHT